MRQHLEKASAAAGEGERRSRAPARMMVLRWRISPSLPDGDADAGEDA